MTEVKKTVRRLTAGMADRRRIVVEIPPPGRVIGFRLKGTRKTFFLPVERCYTLAVLAEVESQRASKKSRKGM
jgi:hypothetical protein